jgi:hypothetical protein
MPKPALLALAAVLLAASAAEAKPTAHPDFTGLWLLDDAHGRTVPQGDALTLTPYGKQRMEDRKADIARGFPVSEGHVKCQPAGMPQMMTAPFGMQVMQNADRIVINAEVSSLPRTIFLRKAHPDDVDPSWNGHSIGRWEGRTLVVDTIGFNDEDAFDFNFDPPVRRTETLHLTERFSLAAGGKVLVDQMTLDDPKVFTRPVTATYRYDRRPRDEGLMEYVCEVDPKAMMAFDAAHPKAPKYKHPF